MKRYHRLMLMCLCAFSVPALAADSSENCPGKVTIVMDYPGKCDGQFAFQLESTGYTWLCSRSDNSDSLLLTAYVTKQAINPRLTLTIAGDCKSITQYQRPLYISVAQ